MAAGYDGKKNTTYFTVSRKKRKVGHTHRHRDREVERQTDRDERDRGG